MKDVIPATGLKGGLENWKNDLIAALSVALVAMPLAMGIALASGVEPMAGLLTTIIGALVCTMFRGGYIAINGPAAGLIGTISAGIVSLNDIDSATGAIVKGSGISYALAAIVIAGAIQVILGFLKLGKLAELFPSSVLRGVLVAIGVIIIGKQIHPALGTSSDAENILETLFDAIVQLPNLNPFVACISIMGIALLIFQSKVDYKLFHVLPAPMWVLIMAIPFVFLFNFFEQHIIMFWGMPFEVGKHLLLDLSNGLAPNPTRTTWQTFVGCVQYPDFGKILTYPFWLLVISITIIGFITTMVCAKAVDKMDPYQRKTDLNKDLVAIGLASMLSGALGGLPIITVIVRSTVNIQNNAKTGFSNFYHGIFILIFILLLTPFLEMVPHAALAAVLVFTGFKLASPDVFKDTYSKGIEQLVFFMTTLVITLLIDQLWGVIAGVLLTLLVHILLAKVHVKVFFSMIFKSETSLEKSVSTKDGLETFTLKLKGIVNFLSLISLNKLLDKVPAKGLLIIDASDARLVDLTVLETFEDFKRNSKMKGGEVKIIGLENHVASSSHQLALKSSGPDDCLKDENKKM